MKKKLITLFTVFIFLFLIGCSSGGNDNLVEIKNNDDIYDENHNEVDSKMYNENSYVTDKFIIDVEHGVPAQKPLQNINKGEGDADVDLTILSSTMVFGEVFNMIIYPEEYLEKTIKIRGEYYSYYDEETDDRYFFVIVADALGCCAQGLEFVLNDDYTYPEDYPEDGAEVEFIGVFDEYDMMGFTYYYLQVDELRVL